jgi:hypothetical protein
MSRLAKWAPRKRMERPLRGDPRFTSLLNRFEKISNKFPVKKMPTRYLLRVYVVSYV